LFAARPWRPPGAWPCCRLRVADEISGNVAGQEAGLFTARLVDAIGKAQADHDGDGRLTLDEIAGWVAPRVAREARAESREQTPTLRIGSGVGDGAAMVIASGVSSR
jgi:hypothetical protein